MQYIADLIKAYVCMKEKTMIEISSVLEVVNYLEGIKAIIFDLDDTLYGEKEYVRSGYREIAKVLPQIKDVEERLWQLFEEGKPAIDELLEKENIKDISVKQRCLDAYRLQEPDIHFYAGVKEMFLDLKEQGYLLGIITDGRPEGQWAKIEALKLNELVDHIIVTDELGGIEFRKPNPAAFELMAQNMNVSYACMCYVGDNIRKDFVAPEKLGMRSIWFQNTNGLYYKK